MGSFRDSYVPVPAKIAKEALRNSEGCARCGSPYELEVDHIVPDYLREREGLSRHVGLEDVQVLCSMCHFEKTQSEIAESRQYKRTVSTNPRFR